MLHFFQNFFKDNLKKQTQGWGPLCPRKPRPEKKRTPPKMCCNEAFLAHHPNLAPSCSTFLFTADRLAVLPAFSGRASRMLPFRRHYRTNGGFLVHLVTFTPPLGRPLSHPAVIPLILPPISVNTHPHREPPHLSEIFAFCP